MMVDGGRWQGRQVVPAAFVREATTPKVATNIVPRGRKELWGYGWLWWTASTPGDDLPAFYAAGYGGQFVYCVPALDLVVVALTEQVSREVAARTSLVIRDYVVPAVPREGAAGAREGGTRSSLSRRTNTALWRKPRRAETSTYSFAMSSSVEPGR